MDAVGRMRVRRPHIGSTGERSSQPCLVTRPSWQGNIFTPAVGMPTVPAGHDFSQIRIHALDSAPIKDRGIAACVQRSVGVSHPQDSLEYEADQVAQGIVSTGRIPSVRPAPGAGSVVQRNSGLIPLLDARRVYRDFVTNADKYGLPVKFLRRVGRDYTIGIGDDSTNTILNTIGFSQSTLESAEHLAPALPLGASTAVLIIYHEATHAYLDLVENDPKVKIFITAGETHYKGAPLTTGKATSSPGRVFQEAAADYVSRRAATWWSTFQNLSIYAAKGWLGPKQINSLRSQYDRAMAQRVFGYSQEGGFLGIGAHQIETTRPLSAQMKEFLDHELLEDKIHEHFDDEPGFSKIIASASAPSAPTGVQRKQAAQAQPINVDRAVAAGLTTPTVPLPSSATTLFGGLLGYDFSRVRIHADAGAASSADALGALAYTIGEHVVFAYGRYAPDTAAGAKLLAHELTHVVQQGTG